MAEDDLAMEGARNTRSKMTPDFEQVVAGSGCFRPKIDCIERNTKTGHFQSNSALTKDKICTTKLLF